MNRYIKILIVVFGIALLVYVSFPSPDFPSPPPGALQSKEPADSETPFRRAYFTDYSRQEVLDWYHKQFKWGILLNYPPEEAQTIIRDQTRSTFLQEFVHPLRESLYINGFEPNNAKDAINIEGQPFKQKIIVRYVVSRLSVRLLVTLLTLASVVALVREYGHGKG